MFREITNVMATPSNISDTWGYLIITEEYRNILHGPLVGLHWLKNLEPTSINIHVKKSDKIEIIPSGKFSDTHINIILLEIFLL